MFRFYSTEKGVVLLRRLFALLLIISLLLCGCHSSSYLNIDDNENKKQIIIIADDIIRDLKSKLKEPSSLYIYGVYVWEISGGKSSESGLITDGATGVDTYTYAFYIDYSAKDGIGNDNRSYYSATYFLIGTDIKTLEEPHEVGRIPELKGTVYSISTTDLTSYSDTIK